MSMLSVLFQLQCNMWFRNSKQGVARYAKIGVRRRNNEERKSGDGQGSDDFSQGNPFWYYQLRSHSYVLFLMPAGCNVGL